MAVTIEDVEHVARLARLRFSKEEIEKFTRQFNEILEHVQKLNELDTTKVEPLSHVVELSNVFREDTVRASSPSAEILKNAPARTEKFFKVPKVIG